MKLNLPTYDGKVKWQTFWRQFEAVTATWPETKKLQHLLANLRGDAAEFTFDLEPSILQDYYELVEELEKRFTTRETRETHVRQFYSRKFGRGDTIREFASDLKRLIRKAYPTGISRIVMEDMLIKQFFDGLEDDDLDYYVNYLKSPDSLDKAVDLVYEYDDRRHIERETTATRERDLWKEDRKAKSRSPKIRNVSGSQNAANKSDKASRQKALLNKIDKENPEVGDLAKAVNGMAQLIEKLLNQRSHKAAIKDSSEKRDQKQNCYNCGEQGHFSRECPRKQGKVKAIQEYDSESQEEEDLESDTEPVDHLN
jgi:hypothetical protein